MEPEKALRQCLEDGVASGIPGLTAAIARGDDLIWTGTAGLADLARRVPVDPAMPFGIGSITKTFVAVIVLQLAAEGRLRLDDRACAMLGPIAERIANAQDATIADLLGHRSGIPSWEWVPAWIRAGRGAEMAVGHRWGKAETLPFIFDAPAIAPAGEAADYSNTNYTLLGLIVEAVTGRELVDELRARILAPLGLDNIHLEGFEPAPPAPMACRYHWATDPFREDAGIHPAFPEIRPGLIDASASNLSVEWAAGGLMATASDLARFGAALRGGRLLDAHAMRAMQHWGAIIQDRPFGLGLYRDTAADGTHLTGHNGGVLGFEATMFWIEDSDIVVAMLGNAGMMHSGPVPIRIQHITRSAGFLDAVRALARSR